MTVLPGLPGAAPASASSTTRDARQADIDLEGPWNTIEEYLAAEQLRQERLRADRRAAEPTKKAKKKRKPAALLPPMQHYESSLLSGGENVFALTATAVEGYCELDDANAQPRSQSELGGKTSESMLAMYTSAQPRASTSLGLHHPGEQPAERSHSNRQVDMELIVNFSDASTQCRPKELEQEAVDYILRRYSFSLEWDHGTLGPGLLNCKIDSQKNHANHANHAEPPTRSTEELMKEAEEEANRRVEAAQIKAAKDALLSMAQAAPEGALVTIMLKNADNVTGDTLIQNVERCISVLQFKQMLSQGYEAHQLDPAGPTGAGPTGAGPTGAIQEQPVVVRPDEGSKKSHSPDGEHPTLREFNHLNPQGQAKPDKLVVSEGIEVTADLSKGANRPCTSEGVGTKSSNEMVTRPVTSQGSRNKVSRVGRPATSQGTRLPRVPWTRGPTVLQEPSTISSDSLGSHATDITVEQSRAKTTSTPTAGMYFYEVKLREYETHVPYDYTVDYRRFAYTDFKIPERGEGSSTIDPELISDWIDRAVPRNQDDTHPLFVLCKDLLRKFHQKEIRYAVRKEQDMLAEIEQLHQALMADRHANQDWQREQEESRLKAEMERKGLEARLNQLQKRFDVLQDERDRLLIELARYKELERETKEKLDHFIEKVHKNSNPALIAQVAILRQKNDATRNELVELKDYLTELSALHNVKFVHELNEQKAHFERIIAELELKNEKSKSELEESKAELQDSRAALQESKAQLEASIQAMKSLQSEMRHKLEEEKLRYKQIQTDLEVLRNKKPMEHVMEWDYHTKTAIFMYFFTPYKIREDKMEHVAASLTESNYALLPDDLKFKFTLFNIAERKAVVEMDQTTAKTKWPEIVALLLNTEAKMLFAYFFQLIKNDEKLWEIVISGHASGKGEAWTLVRDALTHAKIEVDSLDALEILSGVDKLQLMANIVGIDPKYVPMIRDHWELFLKWFARFGAMANGLDAAEMERQRIKEAVKKYNLFDMEVMTGEPYTLEDTLKYIGEIIDFKFESDWQNEGEQKPRLNMVRVIKGYMQRKYVNKHDVTENLKSICASVLKWSEVNSRVKMFGHCAGMLDIVTHWTERATCILMLWLQELKKLDNSGLESQDPSTLGHSWVIFEPWLGIADKVVELEDAVAATKTAADSTFSFGEMPGLENALKAAVVTVPGMKAGLSVDKAMEIFMEEWYAELHNAKHKLREIFEHFDDNNDQSLDMQEFLGLIKNLPLKIRQHDAMSMFNELAGPDGTMDVEEFAEILVFYKFNSRGLISMNVKELQKS